MTFRQFGTGAVCLGALVLLASWAGAQPLMLQGGRVFVGGRAAQPTESVKNDKTGLHLPQGRNVNFTYSMTDGAGFRWDIQYYGTVGQGTN